MPSPRFLKYRISSSPPSSGSSTQVLNLSLFVMLLAFFIVLCSHSTFEKGKTGRLIEGVQETFSQNIGLISQISSPVSVDPYAEIRSGETTEQLDALFRSQIVGFEVEQKPSEGVMRVEMDADAFEKAIMSLNQIDVTKSDPEHEGQVFFLPTLLSLLKSEGRGTPYRMDVLIFVAEEPASSDTQGGNDFKTALKRGAAWMSHLEKAGMPQKFMSYGVVLGETGRIILEFSPHEPLNPLGETAALQGGK